jgi:hypothetical protein
VRRVEGPTAPRELLWSAGRAAATAGSQRRPVRRLPLPLPRRAGGGGKKGGGAAAAEADADADGGEPEFDPSEIET